MKVIEIRVVKNSEELVVPFSSNDVEGTVWHHTGPDGLIGMVNSNTIWASSPLALNDSSEIQYGIQIFRETWDTMSKTSLNSANRGFIDDLLHKQAASIGADFYFLCATTREDSLNQWQGYSGAQGYAIELDTNVTLAPLEPNFAVRPWLNASRVFPNWHSIAYERDKQVDVAAEMIEFLCKYLDPGNRSTEAFDPMIQARSFLGMTVTRFKHKAFEMENEVRLIAGKPKKYPEKFRAGNRGLIPYIELVTAPPVTPDSPESIMGYSETADNPLPIVSLKCGPNSESERAPVEEAAARLLAAHNYNAEVTSSAIPYRF